MKTVTLDANGKRVDQPVGTPGILMIRGPTVLPGYVTIGPDGPVLDGADKLEDGWLDTGDLATVDADGYISLTGRAKDLIIRGGHNIAPVVVEDALLSHPRVVGVNVVGSLDPHAGEIPIAYVTLRPGDPIDPAELVAWAAEHVPERAAAPRAVVVLPALPGTEVGKPYKPELRRDATQRALAAALGPDVAVTARLVDGVIVVEIPAGAPASVDSLLDRYPITWRRR